MYENNENNLNNSKSSSQKQILVVDDDEDIAEAIRMILEMGGFNVIADGGELVEEKVCTVAPNLVLLDVLLAGKDGREICRKIKASPQTQHIPVILISAHVDAAKSLRECRADGFIAKPFDMNDMLNKVKKTIN